MKEEEELGDKFNGGQGRRNAERGEGREKEVGERNLATFLLRGEKTSSR